VKLDAIGFGFLVPVFFVTSGIRLNLRDVLGDPSALALVPLVLALLLLVRAVPAVALRRRLDKRQQVAAGLLLATSLPFLLVAAEIGQNAGVLTANHGGVLAVAGVLSVILLPTAGLGVAMRRQASLGTP
jgi:Kef-type K+ transport system membrane component KefB